MADYLILDGAMLDASDNRRRELGEAVLEGLSELPKHLPSKYFYDDEGSRLFQQIMALDEYYPTRCELEVLQTYAAEIVAPLAGRPLNLVDLGCGDGLKTMALLQQLIADGADVQYVPVDISEDSLRTVVERTRATLPDLRIAGLVAEYSHAIRWLGMQADGRANLVLFLGSNIGNFTRVQSRCLMRGLWNSLRPDDHILMGFDLKKDIETLIAAYNDRLGVTAAFNLNLLQRINRELGADFDVSAFRHYGTYDADLGAMTSHLISLKPQSVFVEHLSMKFEFAAWEPIHTEYSYKYLESDIVSMAKDTGYEIVGQFRDSRGYFCNSLWKVQSDHKIPASTPPRSGPR